METLGINPILLIAQIISFLILLFVMKRFLYGYIQKALEERKNSIKKTFTDREELEKRLTNLEKEQDIKRKEMAALNKKLEAEARKAADEVKKEIVNKAALEGERELIKARERINQEVDNAKKDLAGQAKTLAKTIVERVIQEQISNPDWQKAQLNKSVKDLENNETE